MPTDLLTTEDLLHETPEAINNEESLSIWRGRAANTSAAQHALYHRAKCNRAARFGEYNAQVENDQGSGNASTAETPMYAEVL